MTIEFRCAQCNQLLRVPDTSAGKNARCPKCQTLMQIPGQVAAPAPPIPSKKMSRSGAGPRPVAPPAAPPGGPQQLAPLTPLGPSSYGQQSGYSQQPGYSQQQPGDLFPSGPPQSIDFGPPTHYGAEPQGSGAFDFLSGGPSSAQVYRPGTPGLPPPPPPPPPPPANPADPFGFANAGPAHPMPSRGRGSSANMPAAKGPRPGLPWEAGKKKGLDAFMETMKLVAFEPSRAFLMMQQRGEMPQPMLFAGIGIAIGFSGLLVWSIFSVVMFAGSLNIRDHLIASMVVSMLIGGAVTIAIGAPLAATIGSLINAGLLHACLSIVGKPTQPFETSLKVVCYVQGSLMWLCWIPGGVMVLGIWQLACLVYGVHRAHEVPLGQAVLAVLLPMFVLGGLSMLLTFFLCGGAIFF